MVKKQTKPQAPGLALVPDANVAPGTAAAQLVLAASAEIAQRLAAELNPESLAEDILILTSRHYNTASAGVFIPDAGADDLALVSTRSRDDDRPCIIERRASTGTYRGRQQRANNTPTHHHPCPCKRRSGARRLRAFHVHLRPPRESKLERLEGKETL